MKSNTLLTCLGYIYLKFQLFTFFRMFFLLCLSAGVGFPKRCRVISEKFGIRASVDCGELT